MKITSIRKVGSLIKIVGSNIFPRWKWNGMGNEFVAVAAAESSSNHSRGGKYQIQIKKEKKKIEEVKTQMTTKARID